VSFGVPPAAIRRIPVLLSPLVRKEVTLVTGFVTDLVSPIVEPVCSILDRLLAPVGHVVASFGNLLAVTGLSRPWTTWSFRSAIND
jgi:hypothetical protein